MFSSEQAARKLGIDRATLSRYISTGQAAHAQTATAGGMTIYQWQNFRTDGRPTAQWSRLRPDILIDLGNRQALSAAQYSGSACQFKEL